MDLKKYEFQTAFARKHRAAGRARGKAEAILTVLEARGVEVSEAHRDRVLACSDAARLDRWLARAARAVTADEALD